MATSGGSRGTGANQLVQLAQDARDVRDHLDDADHGERPLVHYGPHSGGLHAGAGASKELGVGMARLQHFHQPGGVQIPGSFAGGDEDAHLPPVYLFCLIGHPLQAGVSVYLVLSVMPPRYRNTTPSMLTT